MSPLTLSFYDPSTFVHLRSVPAKRDQFDECWVVPSFSTLAPLVEIKEGEKNIINVYSPETDTWALQPNFIGQKFYKKENGEEVTIDKVGEVPRELTDKNRPEPWFIFDEKIHGWVVDDNLYSAYFTDLKLIKLREVAAEAQAYIDAVTNDFAPTFERESYPLQAAEAAKWDMDKKANTPILDGIAKSRGVDADKLKAKALEKSQNYQELCASVAGKRQALEDEINAASTVEGVEAINPSEIFKVQS